MIEYVLILALLLLVFVIAGNLLLDASRSRGEASLKTETTTIPCEAGSPFSGDQCK